MFYTLPVIHDPSTGAVVSESALIAKYLDESYPDTPTLFPRGTRPLQRAFLDQYQSVIGAVWQFIMPATTSILDARSGEYFRRVRERNMFGGRKFEDVLPKGEKRKVEWMRVKEGFNRLDGWLQMEKVDGPYLMGHTPCFSDFAIAGMILWMKKVWGEDSEEWTDISTWNDGRWAAFLEGISRYETITFKL